MRHNPTLTLQARRITLMQALIAECFRSSNRCNQVHSAGLSAGAKGAPGTHSKGSQCHSSACVVVWFLTNVHCLKFTETAIAAVKGIDRERDVTDFVTNADLLLSNDRANKARGRRRHVSDQAATVFDVPPPHRGKLAQRQV